MEYVMSPRRSSVLIVIIIFNLNDIDDFKSSLNRLLSDWDVLIIDNGGNENISLSDNLYLTVKRNEVNKGTCHPMKSVLPYVNLRGYKSILFLDQDTRLSQEALSGLDCIVGLNWGYFSLKNYGRNKWITTIFDTPQFQFSGSFYSEKVIDQVVGCVDDEVFLDYCDWLIYWKLRKLIGDPKVINGFVQSHIFGVGSGVGFMLFRHSPFRVYFQVRNSLALLKEAIVPFAVKVFILLRLALLLLFIPFMESPILRYGNFLKGLGLIDHSNKFQ